MDEDENWQVGLVRSRVGQAIVRREQELLRIWVQNVVHVEIPVVDTLERHVGKGQSRVVVERRGRRKSAVGEREQM